MRRCLHPGGIIAILMMMAAYGCCPVPPGGPSAIGVTRLMSLAPGAFEYVDVDVPASSTQLNLDFIVETPDARLRVRQIEPDCTPAAGDDCPERRDFTVAPPPGIRRIGAGAVATPGARTRLVVENVADEQVVVTLTVVPWRAGCT